MSPTPRPRRLRAALTATALCAAAAAAQASLDFTLVVGGGDCTPASASRAQDGLFLTNGAVRKEGRNTPPARYVCGVPIDDLSAIQSHNELQLTYRDPNLADSGNGHVRARLLRKNMSTGWVREIARVDSEPSLRVKTLGAPIVEPLDRAKYAYFIVVELWTPAQPVEAHLVRLVTR